MTRLDRIGLPVWQAIRPLSRALSVHQGKGRTHPDAQLGALLEAVESHAAERYSGPTWTAAYTSIPESERAPDLSDFAQDRAVGIDPDEAIDWVVCRTLDGKRFHLPFDLVSLDFTQRMSSAVERSSNGVATGMDRDDALFVALHELVERDAISDWWSQGLIARMETMIDLATITFEWFGHWRSRIERADAIVRAYRVPSLTGTPVVACEIVDHGKSGAPYRSIQGYGAHPQPEMALFKALSEACQGRCTFIAGARDDLLPSAYVRDGSAIGSGMGFPLPPGMNGQSFEPFEGGPASATALAQAIQSSGYRPVAVVDLAETHGFHVLRAFACGLGSLSRQRRPL